jgi:putative hemolysin
MKFLISSALILVLGSIAYAGGGSSIGPANPAAVNCIKLNGTREPIQTPEGEYANCVVEAWHLYNEMSKRGLVKDPACPNPPNPNPPGGIPNPSAVNCIGIGGSYVNKSTPEGAIGFCVVEEWTLFRAIDITRE